MSRVLAQLLVRFFLCLCLGCGFCPRCYAYFRFLVSVTSRPCSGYLQKSNPSFSQARPGFAVVYHSFADCDEVEGETEQFIELCITMSFLGSGKKPP